LQPLQPEHYPSRAEFCDWIIQNYQHVIWIGFINDAMFMRDRIMNWNSNSWALNTKEAHFQHRFSINMWCRIIVYRVIGPFDFNTA
jgi:hypothetical protein